MSELKSEVGRLLQLVKRDIPVKDALDIIVRSSVYSENEIVTATIENCAHECPSNQYF